MTEMHYIMTNILCWVIFSRLTELKTQLIDKKKNSRPDKYSAAHESYVTLQQCIKEINSFQILCQEDVQYRDDDWRECRDLMAVGKKLVGVTGDTQAQLAQFVHQVIKC